MTDPTIINIASDPSWLDYLAATATLVSAGVIAWQAIQTRRSVKASEDMADATRESVTASQAAVEVAQAALRESQLARIENGVPRIFVTSSAYIESDFVQAFRIDPIKWVNQTSEDVYKLPRDAETLVRTRHKARITNDGPGSVQLKSNTTFFDENGNYFPLLLAPGESRVVTFFITLTVAAWIELEKQKEPKNYPLADTISIIYTGPRDADVTETHDILIYGSIIQAVENQMGDWSPNTDEFSMQVRAEVAPARRQYWRSQSKKEEF